LPEKLAKTFIERKESKIEMLYIYLLFEVDYEILGGLQVAPMNDGLGNLLLLQNRRYNASSS
jgi:hypothetical protein